MNNLETLNIFWISPMIRSFGNGIKLVWLTHIIMYMGHTRKLTAAKILSFRLGRLGLSSLKKQGDIWQSPPFYNSWLNENNGIV